jgi:hypothetical protein
MDVIHAISLLPTPHHPNTTIPNLPNPSFHHSKIRTADYFLNPPPVFVIFAKIR